METIDLTQPATNPRRSVLQAPASVSLGSEPSKVGFKPVSPVAPMMYYPLAQSPCHSPVTVPAITAIPFGDRFEAVRTPHTQTIILSLEEYFLHHCPEKLTSVYDPQQFAQQLLERGPKVEVPVWLPIDVPVEVEGCHTVLREVQEFPYAIDVDVFEEEEVIRVVEEVTELLVEVPVQRIVEKIIEVEEVEFVPVPFDRVVEVVQERIVQTPVPRPVELVRESLVLCKNDVPVLVAKERAVPVPMDHLVNMVVDRVETRIVEVPYERVVTKYVEVPYEAVIEEREDRVIEKIIEVEKEAVTEKIIEREVPYDVIIEKKVIKPVEKIVERLVHVGPKQVVNEFQFEPPTGIPGSGATESRSSSSWAHTSRMPPSTAPASATLPARTTSIPRSIHSQMPAQGWSPQTSPPPPPRQAPPQAKYYYPEVDGSTAMYPASQAPPPAGQGWQGVGASSGYRTPAQPPATGPDGFPSRHEGKGNQKGAGSRRAAPLIV